MLQVIAHAALEPATRMTAMEVLVTLCEQAASVVKGSGDAVRTTVEALMRGMTEVEQDEGAWRATAYVGADKTDEFDEEEEVAVAVEEPKRRGGSCRHRSWRTHIILILFHDSSGLIRRGQCCEA